MHSSSIACNGNIWEVLSTSLLISLGFSLANYMYFCPYSSYVYLMEVLKLW